MLQNEVNKALLHLLRVRDQPFITWWYQKRNIPTSENSSYIASANEFQLQPTYEKAMSLIPTFAVEEKKTSFGTVDPQDVVAALGKLRSGGRRIVIAVPVPFLLTFRLPIKGCRWEGSSWKQVPFYRISFKFETCQSGPIANKNGSLTKDDFATIRWMNALDLDLSQYGKGFGWNICIWAFRLRGSAFLYYRLSDSQTVKSILIAGKPSRISNRKEVADHTSFLYIYSIVKKSSRSILNKKERINGKIKDWSHLQKWAPESGFERQPKEAPYEKRKSWEARRYASQKEPEGVEVPAFQEEVKQEEERKMNQRLVWRRNRMIQREGSFATPEDESAQVVLATPLTEEAKVRNTSTRYNRAVSFSWEK